VPIGSGGPRGEPGVPVAGVSGDPGMEKGGGKEIGRPEAEEPGSAGDAGTDGELPTPAFWIPPEYPDPDTCAESVALVNSALAAAEAKSDASPPV